MMQMLLMKGKFMMMLKVFWLCLLVAQVMGGILIRLAHFIFFRIETSLTLIKLSMVLFY